MRQAIISCELAIACAWACSNRANDCNYTLSCVSNDAGESGGNGDSGRTNTGGISTGGITSACNPACSGAKPVCNDSAKTCVECTTDGNCAGAEPACNSTTNTCVECTKDANCSGATPACDAASNTCVQCTKDGNCSGNTPFCNTTQNTCIQCRTSSDCTSASASACVAGTCTGCSADADCSHITGNTVCKLPPASIDAGTDTGSCVQCTGAKYSACGQSATSTPLVCDSLSNTCSTQAQASAGLCQTCVSDAQCQAGEMCVNEVFNGSSVGYFCFYKQGATGAPAVCGNPSRPYSGLLKNASSIDGQVADICSLRVSTCTALNQFSQTSCTSSTGTSNDQLCGFAPG